MRAWNALVKHPAILVGAVVGCLLLAWLIGSGGASAPIPVEMAMTPAQLAEMPEPVLVRKVFDEVRFKLQANPGDLAKWRKLPEPVRNLVALSSIEQRFTNFPEVFRRQRTEPYRVEIDDMIKAYAAIGAGGITEIVEAAAQRVQGEPNFGLDQPDAFSDLNARFIEQRITSDVPGLLRAYILLYADDVAKHM